VSRVLRSSHVDGVSLRVMLAMFTRRRPEHDRRPRALAIRTAEGFS
jgi:hypothetical protein